MAPSPSPRRPAVGGTEKARAKAAGRRHRALGLDAIVDVALRLVDREGIDAVSMRRVAAEFDTGPASLYAYVANKEELLHHVLDRVIDEMAVPESDDWQELLRGYWHAARDTYARHNDVARLSFAHIPGGAKFLDLGERLLGAMIEGGVPVKVASWALDIMALYVAADVFEGWLFRQRYGDGLSEEEIGAEFVEKLTRQFAQITPAAYPYLTANREVMMSGSGDERFAFGLDMLIAGVAAQVPPRSRRTR
ncbi:transcriptional regulator, TetR family [Jatrophihabitans endophyticus]|uniref:Transcriptional regulator, TetR family n=1 Tax=Jatrophihabitans endophyticus TaxID=1206085 RepID=A0A1M5HTD2_9ACTN|nr:TetR/AcrR family transcriptional regulator [Jatrophihabitans endophyticus]SHG19183.1 transcriptional regulator, TetR family [Jatrophihabitans endophyticus]